jgi:hypothetical protein
MIIAVLREENMTLIAENQPKSGTLSLLGRPVGRVICSNSASKLYDCKMLRLARYRPSK